jgi:nitrogen fixation/metabolism regulation signal transduction histidine kinase
MNEDAKRRRRILLIILLILVLALFFLNWSQASLNLSFIRPRNAPQTILLLAVSIVIFLAFVIFALILVRILLKLYVERRQQQLGSRFKTKMVIAFLGLSLVPVCFLFAFAYGLLNRSIDKWFGMPLDLVRQDAQALVQQLESQAEQRALHITTHLAKSEELSRASACADRHAMESLFAQEVADRGFESAMFFDPRGRLLVRAGDPWPGPAQVARFYPQLADGQVPTQGLAGRWRATDFEVFIAAQPLLDPAHKQLGTIVGVTHLSLNLMRVSDEIQREVQKYGELNRERKAVKRSYLSMLWLLTLLILFMATWFALFLSKQITVPIQALAEATGEVSKGNLGYRVSARADDELGILIRSFNEMTRQLQENREALEQAAQELHEANRQSEERGHTMEAILENIPTGVISFDPQGQITRVNSTAERMFGRPAAQSIQPPEPEAAGLRAAGREGVRAARTLSDLFSAEDARDVARMFRRAARQGVVARQMELELGGRKAYVALTISSVRARHGRVGSVLVLEDLTELLQAQKAAAWQEVAQRIAHEIKNPLTPIQLSAERLGRLCERAGPGTIPQDLLPAVMESASLIGREVSTLKTLVDEFSAFARFPASRLVPASLNAIVEKALNVFDGRLNNVEIHCDLAPELPPIAADPEQMKRVVVNLVDNAAEALERSLRKEIWVRTALDVEREIVEIVVADSGPGIPPEAKEKLFLPYFSTKPRGTGLGLAIVSRIVTEHSGSIRVEENRPTGTKFVIELPVERAAAESLAAPGASQG